MKHLAPLAVAAALACTPALAQDYTQAMQDYLDNNVRAWAEDPVIVAAIAAQNARTGDLPQSEIDALDTAWRAEVGSPDAPTIAPVLENAASEFLREQVAASGGVITEIFATDARGLNVAASAVTSDFWQGDEAKFTETFPAGPDGVHFGEIEFDESSQTYQGQISLTITDPATGAPIGAMTVGVMAEALM
jgi:hypothetical protein